MARSEAVDRVAVFSVTETGTSTSLVPPKRRRCPASEAPVVAPAPTASPPRQIIDNSFLLTLDKMLRLGTEFLAPCSVRPCNQIHNMRYQCSDRVQGIHRPPGEPGSITIQAVPLVTTPPRESSANFVFFKPSLRINSRIREPPVSHQFNAASGVTSRGAVTLCLR